MKKILVCILVILLGCGQPSSSKNTSSGSGGGSIGNNNNISDLLTKAQFETIMANNRSDTQATLQAVVGFLSTRVKNALASKMNQPLGLWYYTYENFIAAMENDVKFAKVGDLNRRKLEIAAFLAHVAQETGSGDLYGGGYYVQELRQWNDGSYGGNASSGAGYIGRGPHQLSWNYNYKSYGQETGKGDTYLNDPELLILDPVIGIGGSLWFWGHQEAKWDGSVTPPFKPSAHEVITNTWQPTTNDIRANRTLLNDFGVSINIINGGIECGKNSVQANNRVRYYREYAKILGANIPPNQTDANLNCANQFNFADQPS